MPEERLSTIERMHRADEERRALGGGVRAFVSHRPAPSPQQLAAAERDRQARALPDDLFADDGQLQRLRERYETRRAIRAQQRQHLRTLEHAQQDLADQIQQAEQALSWHVLADVHNGDAQFHTARRAVAAIAENKLLLQAVKDAVPLVNQPPDSCWRIDSAVEEAYQAWNNHLMTLKLAHVDGLANQSEDVQ